MVFGRPVAQAVQHHIAHDGIVAVHGIAAAAEVLVTAVRLQHVVGLVVQAAKRERRARLPPLRRYG